MFVRRIISLCIVLLIAVLSGLSALEVSLNGDLYHDYTDTEINSMISPLPAGLVSEESSMGTSLSRLLPAMFEIWGLSTGDGSIHDEALAERIEHSYLYGGPGNWSLSLDDGKTFEDITEIAVAGEVLTDTRLEIWISWEGEDELTTAIETFAQKNQIAISILHIPNPESRLISVVRGGGTPPDIIMCSAGKINSLLEARALQPLPQALGHSLDEQGLKTFSSAGRQWALPFYYDSQLFFYNPELIDLNRTDTLTLAELEKKASLLTGKVEAPVCWNAYSAYWLMPFQSSFGKPSLLEADGSIIIDDPETRAALGYIAGLTEKEYFTPLEKDAMISFFAAGRTAVIYSASYSIPYFSDLGIPFAVAPQIINGQTGLPVSPMLDFKAFGITRESRHPVLAYRLLSYLTSIEVQRAFCQELWKLPANRWSEDLLSGSSDYYRTLLQQVGEGQTIPSSSAYGAYKNIMWKLIRFALSGQMSSEQVLRSGERLLRQSLE